MYSSSLRLRAVSPLEAVRKVEKGLPASKVRLLARSSGLSQACVLRAARIPASTMARRQAKGALSPEESDRLLRVAQVVDAVVQMLGDDPDRVAGWLERRNPALGDRPPVDLLSTDVGAREVRHLIGRIMHGIPA